MIVSSLYHPLRPCINNPQRVIQKARSELDELNEGFAFDDLESSEGLPALEKDIENHNVPSLKDLCEKTAIEYIADPRNSIQLLEIADSLGADNLKKHCEVIIFLFIGFQAIISLLFSFLDWALSILIRITNLNSSVDFQYNRSTLQGKNLLVTTMKTRNSSISIL